MAMDQEWSVNITDDDTRTMTAAQVAAEYARGTLDANDTFVWREGYDDWIPLGHCNELMAAVQQLAAGPPAGGYPQAEPPPDSGKTTVMDPEAAHALEQQAAGYSAPPGYAQPQGYAQPAYDAPAQDAGGADFGSTVMMDSPAEMEAGSGAGAGAGRAPAPMPAPTVPSPVAPSSGGPSPPGPPQRVGARGETSALFNIGQIKSNIQQREPKAEEALKDLMAVDESFGGGGFGMGAFGTPDLLSAPPPPPPPKPEPLPMPAAQAPGAVHALSAMQLDDLPPAKSNKPIILAAVAGVAVIAGIILFVVLSGSEEPTAQTTTDSSAKAASGADEKAGGEGSTSDQKSGEADSKSEGDKAGDGSGEQKSGDSDADKKKADIEALKRLAAAKAAAGGSAEAKTDGKKEDDKKEDTKPKSEDSKTSDDKKAKAGGEFNADAARSALSAAAGAASGCGGGQEKGRARATVTFSPSGRAAGVAVEGNFSGGVKSCIKSAFSGCAVPPFSGSSQSLGKSFFVK